MRKLLPVFLILISGPLSMGQATTSPSGETAEVTELRGIIRLLQQQIVNLKAENAALKRQIAALPSAPQPTTEPTNNYTVRAITRIQNEEAGEGRQPDDAATLERKPKGAIAQAKAMDQAVARYISTHTVSADVAKAMWEGRFEIGMDEEAIQIITRGFLSVESRDATSKVIAASVVEPGDIQSNNDVYILTIENGKIARITVRN